MVTRSRSQTNFSKKIVTITEFSPTSAPKRRSYSALHAIHSPTFMNGIRTACLFLGHHYPHQLFQIKQVRLGNAQMIFMPALKWIQQVPYIQQEYFYNHYKDQRDFSQAQYLWYLLLELIPCMEYNWELHVPETLLVYLLSSNLNISVSPKHRENSKHLRTLVCFLVIH